VINAIKFSIGEIEASDQYLDHTGSGGCGVFSWSRCLDGRVRAARQSQPLLLLYAAPAIVMLGLHAAVANQSTRYNLILIGPFSVGAAWIISATLRNARWRSRALAPGP
jgi:hypothetical protein